MRCSVTLASVTDFEEVVRRAASSDGVGAELLIDAAQHLLLVRFTSEDHACTWETHRDLDFPFSSRADFVERGETFLALDVDRDASEVEELLFGVIGLA